MMWMMAIGTAQLLFERIQRAIEQLGDSARALIAFWYLMEQRKEPSPRFVADIDGILGVLINVSIYEFIKNSQIDPKSDGESKGRY